MQTNGHLAGSTRLSVARGDGKKLFRAAIPWSLVVRTPHLYNPNAGATALLYRVKFPGPMFDAGDEYARGAIIHEFGHVWDFYTGFTLSARFLLCEQALME